MMLRVGDLNRKATKKRLVAGKYTARVTFCDFDPEYINNSAIRVVYTLTNDTGEEFEFPEIFYNDLENPRSKAFFDHLAAIGVDPENFQQFVGIREELELKKNVYNNRTVLTIDPKSRKILGGETDDV